jgi:hypothetical protein
LDGTCFDGDENHKLAVLGESRELGIRPGSNLENVDQSFRFSLYNTYTAAGRRPQELSYSDAIFPKDNYT